MAKILFALLTIALIGYNQCQGATTSSTTAKSTSTPKSTTTAKPTTTVDPKIRFDDAFKALDRACTLKKSSDDCDQQYRDLEYKLTSKGFDQACDYRRVYTVCMGLKCDTSVQVNDAISDLNDICNGCSFVQASGLVLLLAAILHFLF